jgi:hypothetical protein
MHIAAVASGARTRRGQRGDAMSKKKKPKQPVRVSKGWQQTLDGIRSVLGVESVSDLLLLAGHHWTDSVTGRQDERTVLAGLAAVDGSPRWRVELGSSEKRAGGSAFLASAVAKTADGEFALAGAFSGRLHMCDRWFDSEGVTDILVAVLAPADGNCLWTRRIGGHGKDEVVAFASGRRGLVLLGVTDSVFLDGRGRVGTRPLRAGKRSFVVELSQKVRHADTAMVDLRLREGWIAVDPGGDLVLVARFLSSDGLAGVATKIPSQDGFGVVKLRSTRNVSVE